MYVYIKAHNINISVCVYKADLYTKLRNIHVYTKVHNVLAYIKVHNILSECVYKAIY